MGNKISDFGDRLKDIPLVGSALKGAGNIVGGTLKTVGGIISLVSGEIGSGISTIAEGAGGIMHTYSRDIAAAIIGNASHIITLPRDIRNVGKNLLNGNLSGTASAIGELVFNLAVPRDGFFGGSGYGLNRYKKSCTISCDPISPLDGVSKLHDEYHIERDWIKGAWSVRGLGLYENAYRIVGTIGFGIGHYILGTDPKPTP